MLSIGIRKGVAAALAAGAAVAVVPTGTTQAASTVRVDVTVAETFATVPGDPLPPGTVVADASLGCFGATVTTSPSSATFGTISRFAGTKLIDCGDLDGDGIDETLTISYRAWVRTGSTTDRGTWRVVAGTGDFDGARGGGRLVGTYTGGAGTSDDSTGIDDRYRGVIRLP